MPGSTVVAPKIVREVGTESRTSLSSRAPTFVFSTSTVGDAPLTVTVSCSVASLSCASTVIVLRTGTTIPSRTGRREARQFEGELVGAGVHGREAILAAFVRRRALDAHDRRARERDDDAGQHAALVVGDFPHQFAEHLARLRGRGLGCDEREHQCGNSP